MATRRQFSREFKLEAGKLVAERGVGVSQATRDLEVGETVLRRWMRELTQDPQQAFTGKGVMQPEQAEIEKLHHSGQGSQYTTEHFQQRVKVQGITCSMSRNTHVDGYVPFDWVSPMKKAVLITQENGPRHIVKPL